MHEIIDQEDKAKPVTPYRDFIPFFLVIVMFFRTLQLNFIDHYSAEITDYIIFAVAGIIFPFYFFRRSIYVVMMILLFIGGTFNLYSFSLYHYVLKISLNGGKNYIILQPLSFILLIVTLFIYKKEILAFFPDKKTVSRDQHKEMESFRKKFSSMTEEQLSRITPANGYQETAVKAAENILLERKQTKK